MWEGERVKTGAVTGGRGREKLSEVVRVSLGGERVLGRRRRKQSKSRVSGVVGVSLKEPEGGVRWRKLRGWRK